MRPAWAISFGERHPGRPDFVLLLALFVSGASGLINQIAWQRAIKMYLGNSETLSSTIVVFVFMLGLGLGSIAASKRSAVVTNPVRTLGAIEIALCLINCVLLLLFGEKLRASVYALQATAARVGVSERLLFAILSFAVLVVPCFLMGLTIPLAAEAGQRLEVSRNKAVPHFFLLNTVGAVVGTLGCGFVLMPVFGQRTALVVAAGGNLFAGLLLLLAGPKPPRPEPAELVQASNTNGLWRRAIRNEEVLAFALGALALSYEVYLFRILSLAYTPLPWIFSCVLCFYLLFWSLGVAIAERITARASTALLLTAVSVGCIPFLLEYHRFRSFTESIFFGLGLVYFLPCIGFGFIFGRTIDGYAERWGRDVGAFTAFNTAGSCAGILLTTFVLFEMDKDLDAWILGVGFLIFVPYFYAREQPASSISWLGRGKGYAVGATAFFAALLVFLFMNAGPVLTAHYREFYSRDGVVEIGPDDRVYINGLWHSVLFRDDDWAAKSTENVQRKLLIAVLPFLAHHGTAPKTALNIGMGTGATARTLAKSSMIAAVDTYEIVTTLQQVIARYPEETLGTTFRHKINVFWEDARAGLARRSKKYDIITQSPLYLKQAGSATLLSVEYFKLLKSRLNRGGIVGIYCNTMGNESQALLVRRTVSEVFRYYESFGHGYLILASDDPIEIDKDSFTAKLAQGDPIGDDIRAIGIDRILEIFDQPRLQWNQSRYLITDDHPLVEYPSITSWLIESK